MKRPFFVVLSAVFLAGAAVIAVSPAAAQSFWLGVDASTKLTNTTSQDLHDFLETSVLPELQTSPFMDPGNNPAGERGVLVYDRKKAWNGYTRLSAFGGYQGPGGPFDTRAAVLIDMDGNVINTWSTAFMGLPAKMLPNGDVMVGGAEGGVFMEGEVTQKNWMGAVVGSWGKQHHDHQREGNPVGYYAPGMDATTDSGVTMWLDRSLESGTGISQWDPLEDDVIYQADWEGNITWEWHAIDHFEANGAGDLGMGFDANAKHAIYYGPWIPGIDRGHDWTHANCVSWLGPNPWFDKAKGGKDYRFHPENIIIDSRTANWIAIIARYDHPDGTWLSGDIVWRVGPDYSAAMPERKIGQISGPHQSHFIPRTLPGAGNVLVFDNGGMAGFGSFFRGMKDMNGEPIGTYPVTLRDYSRIVEFNPVTLEVVWEYVQAQPTADRNGDGLIRGNERLFFAPYFSSAQRLHNGNTLITEGNSGRVLEVTPDGEVAWEYINEHDAGFFGKMLYRAYRVPKQWVEAGMNGGVEP